MHYFLDPMHKSCPRCGCDMNPEKNEKLCWFCRNNEEDEEEEEDEPE